MLAAHATRQASCLAMARQFWRSLLLSAHSWSPDADSILCKPCSDGVGSNRPSAILCTEAAAVAVSEPAAPDLAPRWIASLAHDIVESIMDDQYDTLG